MVNLYVIIITLFGSTLAHALSCSDFSADLIKIEAHNNCSGKNVHLTFDDGPHIKFTQKILNSLKKTNTPASFFVSTYQFDLEALREVEKKYIMNHTKRKVPADSVLNKRFQRHINIRESIVRDISTNQLFELASHAHRHDAHDIRISSGHQAHSFEDEESHEEIEHSTTILDNITGGSFSKQKNPLIRFPYARGISPSQREFEEIKKRLDMPDNATRDDYIKKYSHAMKNAASEGLSHLGWNHDSADSTGRYKERNKDEYVDQFLNSLCRSNHKNTVSLLHDIQGVNAVESDDIPGGTIIEEIIEKAKCLGVRFVSKESILSNRLSLKVYTPKEKVLKDSVGEVVEALSSSDSNLVQTDALFYKIQCNQGEELYKSEPDHGCYSNYLKRKVSNCSGESSICYNQKWYSRKQLDNPQNSNQRVAADACGFDVNLSCYSKTLKQYFSHCDPSTKFLCIDGKWKKRSEFKELCSGS